MLGSSISGTERGIIPRALDTLFDSVASASDTVDVSVTLTYIQIYCETIQDLLRPESTNIYVRESEDRGVYCEGAAEIRVKSAVRITLISSCLVYVFGQCIFKLAR